MPDKPISIVYLYQADSQFTTVYLTYINELTKDIQYVALQGKPRVTIANVWETTTLSGRRHQMETFSALLAICAGNSPVPGEFPAQRPVTRSFDVFFDLRLNKRLSKQSWDWWFETLSRPLWRHCNDIAYVLHKYCTWQKSCMWSMLWCVLLYLVTRASFTNMD